VLHIMDLKPPKAHALTKEARVIDGRLLYRGDYLLWSGDWEIETSVIQKAKSPHLWTRRKWGSGG